MRLAGSFRTEWEARRFAAVLFARGVESIVETTEPQGAEVWVLDEDQQPDAARLFHRYVASPDAPEFARAQQEAEALLRSQEREESGRRFAQFDVARTRRWGTGWVTGVLIGISVVLSLFSRLGEDRGVLAPLMISNYHGDGSGVLYHLPTLRKNGGVVSREAVLEGEGPLPEVRQGEVWRLVTPIFVHFGFLHLLFNMMMLRNLGGVIEAKFGPAYFTGLVVFLAVGSNLAQLAWSTPNFGGMSGVDYGLFGFLWIRGKCDRFATWSVPRGTVQMMLAWFFLCVLNIFPGVANAAHAGGLGLGMLWGWVSARYSTPD
jgi:GlpG protein